LDFCIYDIDFDGLWDEVVKEFEFDYEDEDLSTTACDESGLGSENMTGVDFHKPGFEVRD
jgi:hypothetical protein